MNKQVEFGLRLRKEFAESFNSKSWEEFTEKFNDKLVSYLEEMVEAAAELHMSLLSDEHSDDGGKT